MRHYAAALALAAVLTSAPTPAALAQDEGGDAVMMNAVMANAITWTDLDVPGFAMGMEIAVLQGNPDEAGQYTLRLRFPDGYLFPPHWHPMAENLTVLSGTLLLAMGDRVDDSKLQTYGVGDYLHIPATTPHFGSVQGTTILQAHGEGPFVINLVESASR